MNQPDLSSRWSAARAVLAGQAGPVSEPTSHALSQDARDAVARLLGATGPSAVLELGSGRSTVALARSIAELGGTVSFSSLEHDRTYLERTRASLAEEGLEQFVTLVHAPIRLQRSGPFTGLGYDMRGLSGIRELDLVLIDGPPARTVGRFMAVPLLWPHLAKGALLLLDDANRARLEGAWLDLWRRIYGPALRVEIFPAFRKGIALLMKTGLEQPPTSAQTWMRYAGNHLLHVPRIVRNRTVQSWQP